MPKKLVILGGSSLNTSLFFAALAKHRLNLDEVCLVGRSGEKLEAVGGFSQLVAKQLGVTAKVTWDTDMRRAMFGAQYILNQIRVGGIEAQIEDRRNLALSGVVGHAAGYAEAIRNIPVILDCARAAEEEAPNAVFINFSNPVSVICEAIAMTSSINCVGICHHSLSMRGDFAALLGAPPEQVHVDYFGINHLGWVTDVRVGEHSQMSRLVNTIITRKVKRYNYEYVRLFNLIPIDHAYSIYRKGEVIYVRQKGIRGSLDDIFFRYVTAPIHAKKIRKRRNRIFEAYLAGRLEILDNLKVQAPWYEASIVPFLEAIDAGETCEFIITWKHDGRVTGVPSLTAETTVVMRGKQICNIDAPAKLPEFATDILQLIRNSELLLIQAIRENSFETALQALVLHPNVASVKHAERFLRHYFKSDFEGAR